MKKSIIYMYMYIYIYTYTLTPHHGPPFWRTPHLHFHQCILGPTCCQDEQKLSIQSRTTLLLYIVASHKTLKNVCSIKKFALGLM